MYHAQLERSSTDGQLCLNADMPIDTFWFDIEPSYVRSRRKKKNNLDRIEFGMMDNRGYGLKISQRNGVYYCKMAAMPNKLSQEFRVVYVEGSARLVGLVRGEECYMEKLHIRFAPAG